MSNIVIKSKSFGFSESMTVEWKQSLSESDEIIEAIVAFANTEGGSIFIGVSPEGKALGVQIGKGTIEKLVNHIAQNTNPKLHPAVTTKKLDGKEVIIIEVKESHDHLVLAFGRSYKRVGRSTVKMTKDEYEGLIFEKHKDKLHFDTGICRSASLKDIDFAKVQWFLEKAREERRLTIPEKVSIKEALEYLKVLQDGKLSNTAILLFGKDPQKFFVQAKIRAGRIKGTEGNDFLDMKILEGTIPELRESAMKFIAENIKKAVFFDANQRYDKWGNASVNRGNSQSVIANEVKQSRFYRQRLLRRGVYTERSECAPRNDKFLELPPFTDRLHSGGFEVALMGPGKRFEKAIEDAKLHKLDLNDRQKKAIEYVKKEGRITRTIYCQINDIGATYAKKEINFLIEKRVFRRVGGSKNTQYVLVTE